MPELRNCFFTVSRISPLPPPNKNRNDNNEKNKRKNNKATRKIKQKEGVGWGEQFLLIKPLLATGYFIYVALFNHHKIPMSEVFFSLLHS